MFEYDSVVDHIKNDKVYNKIGEKIAKQMQV